MSSGQHTPRATSPAACRTRVEPLEPRRLFAAPPAPIGPEFPINSTTADDQARPAVAAAGTGHFIAAWDSRNQDGDGRGVYARRLGPGDAPPGPEFRVNTHTASDQMRPAAAGGPGGFVVVWQSAGQDGDGFGIFAQRFDAGGAPLGGEFRVNAAGAENQLDPAVAMAPDGRFVVAWTDGAADGNSWGIAARLFDADGTPRGGDFVVNTTSTLAQISPAVGVAADGRFVVCWQSAEAGGDAYGVYARRFAADGLPRGDAFEVTTDTALEGRGPALAVGPGGDFVVAWHTPGGAAGDGSGAGVSARRYAADGAARGDAFPVNVHTAGDQSSPAVAAADTGAFVVAWESGAQDGDGQGIYARAFDPEGVPASGDLPVNTHAAGDQSGATAVVGPGGRTLFAWQSAGQDGAGGGVYGQFFGAEGPPINPPTITAAPATAAEGDAGATTSAVFTVTLSGARTYPVSVTYATQSGTAASPADFAAASGTLTFAPGETSKEVAVAVAGDVLDEANETFSLVLSEPVNGTFAATSAAGQIVDNDPLPFLTIADASAVEGNAGGAASVVFPVTLSAPSGREVRVISRLGIGTGDTATRGVDYTGESEVLVFAPGETSKSIVIPVVGDSTDEGDETFYVLLGYDGPPTFAFPDDGAAFGTIIDDDPRPTLTAGEVTVPEGDDPAGVLVDVPVTLSAPSGLAVTVDYATADDTAAAPGDYAAASGTLTFAPGETAKTIRLRVFGDDVEESLERLRVRFTNATNADATDATVAITDDDAALPTVTGVFAAGKAWTPAFRQHLAAAGAGSESFGFFIADGAAQLDELPWANLNQLGVRFNRDVVLAPQNVTLRGAGGTDYPVSLVEHDAGRFAYTFTFGRTFINDRLTLRISGTGAGADAVRDVRSGEALDGEWADGLDTYPGGDGAAGGDFVFRLNVLPGDATRDGVVGAADLAEVRSRQWTRVGAGGIAPPRYSIFSDVNGSAAIDVLDYAQARARQQTTLPAAPAAVASASRLAPPARNAPVRRALFGAAPILA